MYINKILNIFAFVLYLSSFLCINYLLQQSIHDDVRQLTSVNRPVRIDHQIGTRYRTKPSMRIGQCGSSGSLLRRTEEVVDTPTLSQTVIHDTMGGSTAFKHDRYSLTASMPFALMEDKYNTAFVGVYLIQILYIACLRVVRIMTPEFNFAQFDISREFKDIYDVECFIWISYVINISIGYSYCSL